MKISILIFIVALFVGCSYKESDFKPADKKETILYDLSDDAQIDRAKGKYGANWRNHL
jgi:hypothetical protein